MNIEIIITLGVCLGVVLAFAFQWAPVDLIAILTMTAVCLLGLVSPEEAIEGFSNPATITVMCMFILSEAVSKTGALGVVSQRLMSHSDGNKLKLLIYLIFLVGIVSMFINNTAAVALLIPVTLQIAKKAHWNSSDLLMPISFASMAGGVCTLIGTSTNLLADSILRQKGYSGFQVFDFFHFGIIFFGVTVIYLVVARKLIPARRENQDQEKSYDLKNYLAYVKIGSGSRLEGENFHDSKRLEDSKINVINKIDGKNLNHDIIENGDVLFIKTPVTGLKEILSSQKLELLPSNKFDHSDIQIKAKSQVLEAVIAPDSKLVNRRLPYLELYQEYGIKCLALRHQGKVEHDSIEKFRLRSGDAILFVAPKQNIERIRYSQLFVLISEPELDLVQTERIPVALAILASVVLVAAFGIVPIYISAFLGIALFILVGLIEINHIYQMVNWKIIFLLAGLLALGKAMENSGTVAFLADMITNQFSVYGLKAIVGVYFVLTLLLTSFMSNNASVVLMAPLAITTATRLGLEPNQLVIPVMFAGSMSFLTPIGYQTNMMVYGVGQYRFKDFLLFGSPLCLICLILSVLLFG